ncbi:homeodomain-interacting protein kinase 3-like [Paralichthys olivaceus]|uniref:homeodomain-interacting protein kinase 3-like n=1 Tax=Paralichthys olivaceus TaxID=8255 RepID=UPI003751F8BA
MSQDMVIEINKGDMISSPTTNYLVEKYLGCGSYGLVVQCRNVSTNELVALKMCRSSAYNQFAVEEEAILQTMKQLQSDNFNIVRLNESFSYKGNSCLVFECLDMELHKFMTNSPGQHLELKQIRPILQQLATSLDFLQNTGIVHTDLKPQNIMMVDHVGKPLKVKVIDFGLASNSPEEQIGNVLQTLYYRSPEIVQKAPFNEAIDIWSLGCIAAELFIGQILFPSLDENDLMNKIWLTIGKPEGDFNPCFWPKQWMESRFMATPRLWGEDYIAEACDLKCFVDLLREMLMMNPLERITPRQILQHPFITMSHFEGRFNNSSYVNSCKDLMNICKDQTSENGGSRDQTIQRTSQGSHAVMRHEKIAFLQTSAIARPKKRKLTEECGNRPGGSKAKRRRTGSPRGEERLEGLGQRQQVRSCPSNSTKVHSLKRKRDKEEVPELEETCPAKKRRKVAR